jgi:hypothetical protein
LGHPKTDRPHDAAPWEEHAYIPLPSELYRVRFAHGRGLGNLRDGDRRSPATTLPSWSSDPLQSIIGAQGSALSGYALPLRRSSGKPNATLGYFLGHPAAQRKPRSHPLLRSRAPSGHGPKVPQPASRPTAPLLGFLPLQRFQQGKFTIPGLPKDRVRSAFRVSHPLGGFVLPLPPGPISSR